MPGPEEELAPLENCPEWAEGLALSDFRRRHNYPAPPPGIAPGAACGAREAHRAKPNREIRGPPGATWRARATQSFTSVRDDMLEDAIAKTRMEVFPGAMAEERTEDSYKQRFSWLLSDFRTHSGAASSGNPQDLPSGAASGANPQDLPSGAASGANQGQQPHWLGRRVDEGFLLQKLLLLTLERPEAGQRSSQEFTKYKASLEKCMRKMPDVEYMGFVEVKEEEFQKNYYNDKWRLLKDMFEKHVGELAVITREVTTEVVQTPPLPWLMDSAKI